MDNNIRAVDSKILKVDSEFYFIRNYLRRFKIDELLLLLYIILD